MKLIVLTHGHIDHVQNTAFILGRLILFFSRLGAKFEKFEATVFLKEGDNLSKYGVEADVIELPGHTKGSIGLKIGDNIFVGDALMNIIVPGISLLYEDRGELLKSANKITSLGESQMYFGHGKSVKNKKFN